MEKTSKALGKKILKVGDKEWECTVRLGDSRKYIKAVKKLSDAKKEDEVMDLVFDTFMDLVTRDGVKSETEVTELQFFAETSLTELAKEIPIFLGIAKRKDLDKEEQLKK